uniref:Uncharacterized protein n=1 Tax=Anguilla anguilla TaxID=7936 RepID=A0A0E9SGY9_ANGAN
MLCLVFYCMSSKTKPFSTFKILMLTL